jgi:hypothetical protein
MRRLPPGRSWARSSQPWKNRQTTVATYPSDDLAAALNELAERIDDDSLTNWNDEPTRTHEEVINTLQEAATSAAAEARQRALTPETGSADRQRKGTLCLSGAPEEAA